MPSEVIYSGKYGPSGAADALFDLFKQGRETERTKELETFKSDIRMKETSQAHGFSTALEVMRENARAAAAKTAVERTAALDLMKATEEAKAVGEAGAAAAGQGIPLPGFPAMGPVETMGAEVIPPAAPKISPYGAKTYGDILGLGLKAHTDKLGKQADVEKATALNLFGKVSDIEMRSRDTMVAQIKTLDPKSAHIPRLSAFQSGLSERKDYEKGMETAAIELDRLRGKAEGYRMLTSSRAAIAKAHDETLKTIADIKAKAQVSARDLATLKASQSNVVAQLSKLKADADMIREQSRDLPVGTKDWELARTQLGEIHQQSAVLEQSLIAIGQQIARGDKSIAPEEDQKLHLQRLKSQVIRDLFKGKKTEAQLTEPDQDKVAAEVVKRYQAGQKARGVLEENAGR